MDNLLIGALELGDHMGGHTDDMLERAATGLYPQSHSPNCPPQPTQVCTVMRATCVSDSALEAAAETALGGPRTQVVAGTICIG